MMGPNAKQEQLHHCSSSGLGLFLLEYFMRRLYSGQGVLGSHGDRIVQFLFIIFPVFLSLVKNSSVLLHNAKRYNVIEVINRLFCSDVVKLISQIGTAKT